MFLFMIKKRIASLENSHSMSHRLHTYNRPGMRERNKRGIAAITLVSGVLLYTQAAHILFIQ